MEELLEFCNTDYQRELVAAVVEHGSVSKASKALGRDRSTCYQAYRSIEARAERDAKENSTKFDRTFPESRGYVVTCAQNDTPVHKPFLESLQNYCKSRNFQLVVVPIRYKNPSAINRSDKDKWAKDVEPYLTTNDIKLAKGLRLMGSIKIQPTAVRPLSGLDTISGTDSAIFGHPKIALRSVATKAGSMAKLCYTTGSVTKKNYSDSKAGKKGDFHHVVGALVVEKSKDKFHIRNLISQSDGSFFDLDTKWTKAGNEKTDAVPVITLGDLHAETVSQSALSAYWKIRRLLKPERLVLHDVLNFGSASHHNTFFDRYARFYAGADSVRDEVEHTCKILDKLAEGVKEVVVVASNHNDHFTQWLSNERNCNDLRNARIFAETRAYYLKALEDGKNPMSPLEYWASQWCREFKKMRFLKRNQGYSVNGVELSYHGDKGAGGSRGSTQNLSKIGAKVTKGHDHKAEIIDGCYSAGTFSILDPDYTHGSPSAWINSMVVQYKNGKRTHINLINGEWRGK